MAIWREDCCRTERGAIGEKAAAGDAKAKKERVKSFILIGVLISVLLVRNNDGSDNQNCGTDRIG